MLCILDHSRTVLDRRRFLCADEPSIVWYFASLGPYRAVVEATASYEWLLQLIEPSAEKVLLGLRKRPRGIAESLHG